jgi:hypothetical protein
VWDSAGRSVAEPAVWRAGPGEYRAAWDGRRADGTPAPLGLYIVNAEVPPGRPVRASLVLVR